MTDIGFIGPFNAWLKFRITSDLPVEMRVGALITFRLSLHQVPIHWKTKITVWEPPLRFVDEQISGFFNLWVHEHTFEQIPDGTMIRDHVQYRVPGGVFTHWLIVKRDLQNIYDYRQKKIQDLCALCVNDSK